MNKLPERINVMKLVSYDVKDIVFSLIENDTDEREVTLEDVMRVVEAWVEDDFGTTHDLIWQDENGEDL